MKKWYKMSITKAVLVIVAIITAMITGVSAVILIGMQGDLFGTNLQQEKKYEDSESFESTMYQTASYIADQIRIRNEFELDGTYDPEKIVDIMEYAKSGTISGKNDSGIAYKLGDLVEWAKVGQSGNTDEQSSYTDEQANIVVCKKKDGAYYYYYYDAFRNLIDEGKLQIIVNGAQLRSDETAENTSQLQEFYDNLDYNATYGEGLSNFYDSLRIENTENDSIYTDCWIYADNTSYIEYGAQEVAAPIGAKNLLALINENEELNGKLTEICSSLGSTLDDIGYDAKRYDEYRQGTDEWAEGNTNFAYLLADRQTKQVYTNNAAWTKYADVEKSIEAIKSAEHSKYVIVEPKLSDFQSNLKDADAKKWQQVFRTLNSQDKSSERYIFAAKVDITYPIQDVFYTYNQSYRKYAPYTRSAIILTILGSIVCLVVLFWLTWVAGRNTEDDALHLTAYDQWKTELGAAAVIVPWLLFTGMIGVLWNGFGYQPVGVDSSYYQHSYIFSISKGDMLIWGAYVGITMALFLIGYLSLVRRIKGKNFWKNSILYIILKWSVKMLKGFCSFCRDFWKNRSITWRAVSLFIIFVLLHWLGTSGEGLFIFIMFVAEIVGLYYIVQNTIAKDKVRKGIERIASGDLEYQIPTDHLKGEYKQTAEMVNDIGNGLNRAVDEKIKSERLKTDLITNVSHDIKTPLTSIINYVDLLKREEIDDPKIQEYLEVLDKKSQRLKTLTEDVVEASKISSGNINLQMMDVNFVEMLNQTIGEVGEKMSANDLEVIATVPEKPVIVHVDGRRMWRVLENIFNNAAKYAMPGTRIYADLQTTEENAVFTLKNISAQKLNIKAEELTERFIRGDISRSTEGSGLGLSIASTLTEMQGGNFGVYVDGDLFKVTITLPLESR